MWKEFFLMAYSPWPRDSGSKAWSSQTMANNSEDPCACYKSFCSWTPKTARQIGLVFPWHFERNTFIHSIGQSVDLCSSNSCPLAILLHCLILFSTTVFSSAIAYTLDVLPCLLDVIFFFLALPMYLWHYHSLRQGVRQSCLLSPNLSNAYSETIMDEVTRKMHIRI